MCCISANTRKTNHQINSNKIPNFHHIVPTHSLIPFNIASMHVLLLLHIPFQPARPYSKFKAILLTLYPHRNYNVNHAFENGKQFYYVKDERK